MEYSDKNTIVPLWIGMEIQVESWIGKLRT